MTKLFQDIVKGASPYNLYYNWSQATNWGGGVGPVNFDDVAYTAVVSGLDEQADDIANLTLSSLTLAATSLSAETLYVGGNLTLGTLSLTSSGTKQAMLEAPNTFGTSPTVIINGLSGSGTLFAYGAGARILDMASSNPSGMTYEVGAGGVVYLNNAPNASSNLTFFNASGIIELASPGGTISAALNGIVPGVAIEVPGSVVLSASMTAPLSLTRTLSITTDVGAYIFNDLVTTAVTGLTIAHDASTGLEKVTFTNGYSATGVIVSGAGIVNGSGHVTAGAQIVFTVSTSSPVIVDNLAGTPTLSLSDGGAATYSGGAFGGTTIAFTYTVGAGERSTDLSISGVNLNGSKILSVSGSIAYDMSAVVTNPYGLLRVGMTRGDFNGDGISDVLFRDNAGGDTGFYALNASGAISSWQDLGLTSTAYTVAGTGDFNGDGIVDILFRNNTGGDTGFFQMNASGVSTGWHDIGSSAAAYSIVGVGDFNKDGISDVLFRNQANGDIGFYQLNSDGTFHGWDGLGGSSTAYAVTGVGDFNGDGVSDVLFRNNATGDTGFYQVNANGTLLGWRDIGSSSTAYSVVGVGDFNGDGTSDILFRNNATGDTGFYQLTAGAFQGWHDVGSSSTAYSVVGVGDYNGNGVSDILFRNNSSGDTGFYQLTNTGAFQGWHGLGGSSTAYSVIG